MSSLAFHVAPHLADHFEVYYVTAGQDVPPADFVGVIRGKRRRYMNVAGFELSRHVNRLYRDRLIDLAVVWSSIGFGLRGMPIVHITGGSVYAQVRLFARQMPVLARARFLPGFVHYVLPEIVCNRRAAMVIVPSHALGRDLATLHRLPEERIAVVPHGVEDRHLELYQRKISDLPPRVLFVGRLHPAKGIGAVLAEFTRRRDIRADVLIAGDGPDRPRLDTMAAGDERITILGAVDRAALESLLLTTNVFVFPTFYEGFGLALLEAMASGHACLAYDLPVVREVLGDTGLLVPVGDAVALVDKVAWLCSHPTAILASAARAHERARQFSWTAAGASIEQIIRETASKLRTCN